MQQSSNPELPVHVDRINIRPPVNNVPVNNVPPALGPSLAPGLGVGGTPPPLPVIAPDVVKATLTTSAMATAAIATAPVARSASAIREPIGLGEPGTGCPPPQAPIHKVQIHQVPVKESKYPKTIKESEIGVVHIFISSGTCYDTAGLSQPSKKQIRYLLPPQIFNSPEDEDLKTIKRLVEGGAQPVVDVSCCAWVDQCTFPESISQFLEWALDHNGTVRFSDFSLRVARDFLTRVGIPLDYELVPDLSGTFKIRFDCDQLLATGLQDLKLLSHLATSGEVDIHTMGGTRRMVIKSELPVYGQALIGFDFNPNQKFAKDPPFPDEPVPSMILLDRAKTPGLFTKRKGRVVLFSCHFCEIHRVQGVQPERVASAIRELQGEEAAKEFLDELARAQEQGGQAAVERYTSSGVGACMTMASPSC